MQLKDTEYELEGSRERVQQQATEILHKASKMCFYLLSFPAVVYGAVHRCFTHMFSGNSAVGLFLSATSLQRFRLR